MKEAKRYCREHFKALREDWKADRLICPAGHAVCDQFLIVMVGDGDEVTVGRGHIETRREMGMRTRCDAGPLPLPGRRDVYRDGGMNLGLSEGSA